MTLEIDRENTPPIYMQFYNDPIAIPGTMHFGTEGDNFLVEATVDGGIIVNTDTGKHTWLRPEDKPIVIINGDTGLQHTISALTRRAHEFLTSIDI